MTAEQFLNKKINELMFNTEKHSYGLKEGSFLTSDKLRRKLSLTSFIVSNTNDISDVGIVSPQFVVVNEKAIEKFKKVIEDINFSEEEIDKAKTGFKYLISDLLIQSMGEPSINPENNAKTMSHSDLINLISETDLKKGETIKIMSFNVKQLPSVNYYIENGGDIEEIVKFPKISKFAIDYAAKLLEGEINFKNLPNDNKDFLNLYENNKNEAVRDYLILGIANKIVSKTSGYRLYLAVKAWENLGDIDVTNFPSFLEKKSNNVCKISNEILEKIAHSANGIISDKGESSAMIAGITSYSKVSAMFEQITAQKIRASLSEKPSKKLN